jgi:hypothetical protein
MAEATGLRCRVCPAVSHRPRLLEALWENIRSAIVDWMAESAVKSHGEASQLAAIQGVTLPPEPNFPQSNEFRPPPSKIASTLRF